MDPASYVRTRRLLRRLLWSSSVEASSATQSSWQFLKAHAAPRSGARERERERSALRVCFCLAQDCALLLGLLAVGVQALVLLLRHLLRRTPAQHLGQNAQEEAEPRRGAEGRSDKNDNIQNGTHDLSRVLAAAVKGQSVRFYYYGRGRKVPVRIVLENEK